MNSLTKQRPQVIEEVEKLLLVYINEKQLEGASISETFNLRRHYKSIMIYHRKPLLQVLRMILVLKLVKAGLKNLSIELEYTT